MKTVLPVVNKIYQKYGRHHPPITGAQEWYGDCAWKDTRVALSHELSAGRRVELVRGFAGELANRYGVAVDFAIHRPHRSWDERNFHAHVASMECLP